MINIGSFRCFESFLINDSFTLAILCIIFSASSYFPWLINHLEDSGIILVIKNKKAKLIPYSILYHRLIAGFLIRVRQQVPLSEAGTTYPSGKPEFVPGFQFDSCCSILFLLCNVLSTFVCRFVVLCLFLFTVSDYIT
jgi:hypothetical protein